MSKNNGNNGSNDLLTFLGGLAMLIGGLYWLMQRVTVSSSFFYGGFSFLNHNFSSGAILVPFIIGIVILFAKPESIIAKLICGIGVFIVVISIVMSTNLRLQHISLYEWVMILVLIFGGAGLTARILFSSPKESPDRKARKEIESYKSSQDLDKEIERLKKKER